MQFKFYWRVWKVVVYCRTTTGDKYTQLLASSRFKKKPGRNSSNAYILPSCGSEEVTDRIGLRRSWLDSCQHKWSLFYFKTLPGATCCHPMSSSRGASFCLCRHRHQVFHVSDHRYSYTHQPNHVSFILMSLHHSTLTTFTTNNFWFFWYYPSPIRLVKYPQPIKRLDIIWIIPLWSLSPFMNPRCNRPPILRWILFNVVLFLSNTIAMNTSAHKHFELSVRVCWIFFRYVVSGGMWKYEKLS